MAERADVRSLDALKDAKHALADFRDAVVMTCSSATSDVQRTIHWLQHDQLVHWKFQARKRAEKLSLAKSELFRANLGAQKDKRSTMEQRKLVAQAERSLEEAQQKLAAAKKWARLIEREYMLFKGKIQAISRTAESDIPRGMAKLELYQDRLEKYVRTRPEGGYASRAADSVDTGESGGGDEEASS